MEVDRPVMVEDLHMVSAVDTVGHRLVLRLDLR
jgi:hypothetical protein